MPWTRGCTRSAAVPIRWAANILQLTPSSTEEDYKAAFELLAAGNDEESDSDSDEDSDDEDEDGQIDLKELKAFRDDDRRLMGKGVPEFIHKDDERFRLLTPEQQNAEATIKRDGYQETEDDKDYAKLYQHYVIERREANKKAEKEGKEAPFGHDECVVPEAQRRDCLYGFKATDDEIDAMALEADKDVRSDPDLALCHVN